MLDQKKKVLGRGLDTLIPAARSTPSAAPALAPQPGERVLEVPLEEILPNPYQPRSLADRTALEELAASIRVQGVMQPIVLRYIEDAQREPELNGVKSARYYLIAGERRWVASRIAGKATVPAIVRQIGNEQAMELTIIENLQREDLNPMDQARAFERLSREFALTQEQVAEKTGKERTTIANYLRLLKLPLMVQDEVSAGRLSFGHAKSLLSLDSIDAICDLAKQAVAEAWSVRRLEEEIQRRMQPPEPKAERPERVVDPNVREAERELERSLGLKVKINDHHGKGKIVIEYHTLDDFDRVVEQLGGKQ